ncbi:prepilin-type N-terminal cleavage/methylation domain-containing protein [Ascidiaceihabitans sp.]|uniref:prepilin-type N-terminal cleavage/methylation domain-containing protein n=1 Tax=Ascidiaceihabitans sp. TaxID=1872644 RepID=UPI00329775FD
MHKMRRDTGLTLLELAIAVLVLSIGALAAIRASDQARVSIGGAQDRVLAQVAVRNRAEELHLLGYSAVLPGFVTLNGTRFDLRRTSKTTASGLREVTLTARSGRGPGAVLVVYLSDGTGG